MNERTCIVTRKSGAPDDLIRFVAGPTAARSGSEAKPSRPWLLGHAQTAYMWTGGREEALRARAEGEVKVPADLGDDGRPAACARRRSASLGLARKAGAVVSGAGKVEPRSARARRWRCSTPPKRRPTGSARSTRRARRPRISGWPGNPGLQTFFGGRIGFGIGGANVIHAAVLAQDAGKAAGEAHSCARPLPGRHPG